MEFTTYLIQFWLVPLCVATAPFYTAIFTRTISIGMIKAFAVAGLGLLVVAHASLLLY